MVCVVPLQDCDEHCVAPLGKVHAVRELEQTPRQVPLPEQAVREPCGWPDGTCEQVPRLPATSHASHWPVHAALQQRPSTQMLLTHWLAAEHAAPRDVSVR